MSYMELTIFDVVKLVNFNIKNFLQKLTNYPDNVCWQSFLFPLILNIDFYHVLKSPMYTDLLLN